MRKHRLSDHDSTFGPFTFGRSKEYPMWGVRLTSGDADEYPGNDITFYAGLYCFRINLPNIIRPQREWVDTSGYSWNTGPGCGYWVSHRREYGVLVSGSYVSFTYGPQTGSSLTTYQRGWFIPWMENRFVRHTIYRENGAVLRESHDGVDWSWINENAPKGTFRFTDCDGEENTATTYIEEREWRRGTGWFRWLSVFFKPTIHRSLSISFEKEVGRGKGSWKGGTIGTCIDMRTNDTPATAFRRYCKAHDLTPSE